MQKDAVTEKRGSLLGTGTGVTEIVSKHGA